MARAEDGSLIDPHGGKADLEAGVLRHVGEAFAEDPVRILRVARFAARFGFAVAPETMALMRRMVAAGEADALVPERVWQELARGLLERSPSRMLAVLRECGALARVLPELDRSFDRPDVPERLAARLEHAASRAATRSPVRYGLLVLDLPADRGRRARRARQRARRLPGARGPRDPRARDPAQSRSLDADVTLSLLERADGSAGPSASSGCSRSRNATRWRPTAEAFAAATPPS